MQDPLIQLETLKTTFFAHGAKIIFLVDFSFSTALVSAWGIAIFSPMQKKAYFFVLPLEHGGYQHNVISLAQGLQQLGIEFRASANYWRQANGEYLFQHDPAADPRDFDWVIISEQYLTYGDGKFPPSYFDLPGKKIYINTGDGLVHQYNIHKLKAHYARFDLLLMHLYEDIPYPSNFRPWAYGVSQHIIDLARPELPKSHSICVNYRNSHSLRRLGQERIFDRLPKEMIDTTREMDDWKGWENETEYARYCVYQSAGRHSAGYNERIGRSAATACFGGVFYIRPWFWNWPAFKIANYFVQSAASVGRMQTLATRLGLAKKHVHRLYQWDSWRFWESFANGSVPIQVDLRQYKVILPEFPEPGVHYLGVDLAHAAPAVELLQDFKRLQSMGTAGREWALAHYGPQAQARRFLRYLGELE